MEAPRSGAYPRRMRNRPAFTLIELAVVLVAAGALTALALPRLHNARQQVTVRAARAELAGAFAVARSAAITGGGATLFVDPAAGAAWIEVRDGVRLDTDYRLADRYGVRIETPRGAVLSVRYDALGIGRLANTSLTLRRGSATASLTVSAYGRVRQ